MVSDTRLTQAVDRLKSSGWTINEFDTPTVTYNRAQVYALRSYGSVDCTLALVAIPKRDSSHPDYNGTSTLNCDRLVSVF